MTRRALLIGCNGNTEQNHLLQEAENDTLRLSNWLQHDDAWRSRDSIAFSKPSINQRELKRKIVSITGQLQNGDDFGLIYFSGHGVIHEGIPSIELQSTWMPFHTLVESSLNTDAPGTILLVIDCCYPYADPAIARNAIQTMVDALKELAHNLTLPQIPQTTKGKRTLLFACSQGQNAYESPIIGGGYFTSIFMNGCEGGSSTFDAVDKDSKHVTSASLLHFAQRNLRGIQKPIHLGDSIPIKFCEELNENLQGYPDTNSFMLPSLQQHLIPLPVNRLSFNQTAIWPTTEIPPTPIYSFHIRENSNLLERNDSSPYAIYAIGTKQGFDVYEISFAHYVSPRIKKMMHQDVEDGVYRVDLSTSPHYYLTIQHGMQGSINIYDLNHSEHISNDIGSFRRFLIPSFNTLIAAIDQTDALNFLSLQHDHDHAGDMYRPLDDRQVYLVDNSNQYIFAALKSGTIARLGPINRRWSTDIRIRYFEDVFPKNTFITDLAIRPDEQDVIVTYIENGVGIVHCTHFQDGQTMKVDEYKSQVRSIAFSEDNRWFADCADTIVRIFRIDMNDMYILHTSHDIRDFDANTSTERIHILAFTPQLLSPIALAFATDHGRVFLWDFTNDILKELPKMGDEIIFSLSFVPINRVLALLAAASASNVRIWEVFPKQKNNG